MAWPVPWDKLDPEMVEVVRLLNETGVVKTNGCCAGHGVGQAAYVGITLVDDGGWETSLLPTICNANARTTKANIEVRKRYFANHPGRISAEWCIVIEPHPGVSSIEETRAKVDKALAVLEEELRGYLEREHPTFALQR